MKVSEIECPDQKIYAASAPAANVLLFATETMAQPWRFAKEGCWNFEVLHATGKWVAMLKNHKVQEVFWSFQNWITKYKLPFAPLRETDEMGLLLWFLSNSTPFEFTADVFKQSKHMLAGSYKTKPLETEEQSSPAASKDVTDICKVLILTASFSP